MLFNSYENNKTFLNKFINDTNKLVLAAKQLYHKLLCFNMFKYSKTNLVCTFTVSAIFFIFLGDCIESWPLLI